MAVEFCHISPTKYLDIFGTGRACHLTLAHLVNEDDDYLNWYIEAKKRDKCTIILDNSAFELFKRNEPMYDSNKLIDAANKIDADYVVMSDYPNEEFRKTIDKAKEMSPELKEKGFQTFFCPQSEKGDLQGLIDSYMWAVDDDRVDCIGFSILAIPNAYGVLEDPLQRMLSRWKFCRTLQDLGFFEKAYMKKRLHLLGMLDGPNEVMLLSEFFSCFHSWDSSAAVWCGLNDISFDDSPTGLVKGKFEDHVDFSHNSATIEEIALATKNVKYIDSLL